MIFTLKTYDKAHKKAMKRGYLAFKVNAPNVVKLQLAKRQLHIGQLILDRLKREYPSK